MYICEGHFLLPHTFAIKDNKIVNRLTSIDVQLMVGTRLVGFDSGTGRPIIDLLKVDKVIIDLGTMPDGIKDLIPDWAYKTHMFGVIDSSESSLEEVLMSMGIDLE